MTVGATDMLQAYLDANATIYFVERVEPGDVLGDIGKAR